MRIKRDSLDILFAQFIKARDKICQKCGGTGGLQTAHFYGRARKSVRYDEDNACLLCFFDHQYFTANPAEFVEWFKVRLGERAFDLLQARMRDTRKVDREAVRLYLAEQIKEMER